LNQGSQFAAESGKPDGFGRWPRQYRAQCEEDAGVNERAPARISPTTMSEMSLKLRAGEIATMRGRHGDFVLIADAADHTGWVKRTDLDRAADFHSFYFVRASFIYFGHGREM
jgi:hypothetical protein